MKKLLKKISIITVCVALIACALSVSAFAAGSVSVKANNQSPSVGAEITVTVSYKADEAMLSLGGWLQYNSEVLEYVSVAGAVATSKGTGTYEFATSVSNQATHDVTFTFKAKKIGQSTVKAYNCKYVPASFQEISVADNSTTINVADKTSTTLSGNANLKSLYLSNSIPLNPAFNKDTTTYNIQVDNSVTKVLVNAQPEVEGARIDVVGSSEMKVGANQRTIVVTAPNGTQKKYVINITRAAPDGTIPADPENPDVTPANPYEVEIGGEKWTLVSEYTEDIILNGFKAASAIINSTELPVLKNEATGAVVVYAKAGTEEEPKAKYFTYQEITGTFAEYRFINGAAGIVILDFDSALAAPAGYTKTTATVMGFTAEVMAYVDPAFANYVIVYAETLGGIKDYYRIDTLNGTIQLSPEFAAAVKNTVASGESGNVITRFALLSAMEKAMIGAVVLAVLVVIAIIIILIVKLARNGKPQIIEDFDELEEFDEFEEEFEEEVEAEEAEEEEAEEDNF